MTNADRIRQMTDEELADILELSDCENCPYWPHCGARICRDGFLNWLKQEVSEDAGKNICKYCASNAYCKEDDCMVYQGLRDTPTVPIEAEPVRHGRWIECDYKHLEHGFMETEPNAGLCCSECRTAFQKKKMTYKQYCAACGAKMDGGDNNG